MSVLLAGLTALGFTAGVADGLGRGAARLRDDQRTRRGHVRHDQELELELAVLLIHLAHAPDGIEALDVALDHLGPDHFALLRALRLIEAHDRPDLCGTLEDGNLQVHVRALPRLADDAR